jgi:ribosomal-protein-serine acetyltransferase
MTLLHADLGDGLDLVLRDLTTVDELTEVVRRNIVRMRLWENWAYTDQTVEVTRAYTIERLARFVAGETVPLAIRQDGRIVGSIEARIDTSSNTAEIGYWIDEASEGRGIMRRAAEALIRHLEQDRGIARVQLQTAAHNARSQALAERLGFVQEGIRVSALPVGDYRHDMIVYARIR